MRQRFEGVTNIVRFNWPFYAGAALACGLLLAGALVLTAYPPLPWLCVVGATGLLLATVMSLLVSWYVYDVSGLYSLEWLRQLLGAEPTRLVSIHAGFDETSALLQHRFPAAQLRVLDFYQPAQHTEASIRRARAAQHPYPGTQPVKPHTLPLPVAAADCVIVLLAAHEIRDPAQRIAFLAEIGRVLAPHGQAVVLEHLRDLPNFLAYTLGFLHFYARSTWLAAFQAAGLQLVREQKITPFLSAFLLRPHAGNTP